MRCFPLFASSSLRRLYIQRNRIGNSNVCFSTHIQQPYIHKHSLSLTFMLYESIVFYSIFLPFLGLAALHEKKNSRIWIWKKNNRCALCKTFTQRNTNECVKQTYIYRAITRRIEADPTEKQNHANLGERTPKLNEKREIVPYPEPYTPRTHIAP